MSYNINFTINFIDILLWYLAGGMLSIFIGNILAKGIRERGIDSDEIIFIFLSSWIGVILISHSLIVTYLKNLRSKFSIIDNYKSFYIVNTLINFLTIREHTYDWESRWANIYYRKYIRREGKEVNDIRRINRLLGGEYSTYLSTQSYYSDGSPLVTHIKMDKDDYYFNEAIEEDYAVLSREVKCRYKRRYKNKFYFSFWR